MPASNLENNMDLDQNPHFDDPDLHFLPQGKIV